MTKAVPLDIVLDSDPQQIVFSGRGASPVTLTLTNNDTRAAASILINAVRGDLLTKNDLTLTTEELNGGGYKIIDEAWVECRIASPDAWQPVDDWATPFDLGALAAGASVSFEVQVNVPTSNTDSGRVAFAVMISCLGADEPQVTSVTIDQASFSLTEGDTTTATATVVADAGADDSVAWTSNNTAVATINITSGLITAISGGSAIITATANDNFRKKSSRLIAVTAPIIVPGAVAWFDANDAATITESGGKISKWRDKSGNANHATQASGPNQPTLTAGGLNGKPVVTFASPESLTAPAACTPTGATPYTIFAVFNKTSYSGSIMFCGAGAANQSLYFDAFFDNKIRHEWFMNDFKSHVLVLSTPHLAAFQFDGSQRLTRLDENEVTAAATGKNTASSDFLIGKDLWYQMTGYIAELVIYHTALTPAEIAAVESYLKTKWGL